MENKETQIKQTAIVIFVAVLISCLVKSAVAAPVLTDLPGAVRIDEDELASLNFYIDGVGNYSIEIIGNPGTLVKNENILFEDLGISGQFGDRWNIEIEPDDDIHGTENFTIRVTDGVGDLTDHALRLEVIAVNDTPEADSAYFSCDEDSDLTGELSAVDVDGDTLTFAVDSRPANGTLSLDTDGTFVYKPYSDFFGEDFFEYHASDPETDSGVRGVTIIVNPVNDPPEFAGGSDQTLLEDSGLQLVEGFATAIVKGPDNENDQNLEFRVTGDPDIFKTGPAIDPGTGDLTFETEPHEYGTSIVTVQLADDGGIENGGTDVGDPVSFIVTVISVNDPPVFTKGPDISVGVNSGGHRIEAWASNIGPGVENESGQLLEFLVEVDYPELFTELPLIDTDGNLTFAVADNVSGHANASATLVDDGGTENGGIDESVSQSFVIAVNNPPDAPIPVFPPPDHVFDQNSVTLQAGPFSDFEGDLHVETRWQIKKEESDEGGIRYGCPDGKFEEYTDHADSTADLTRHKFESLESGYSYAWKVGYRDSGSGIFSWSAEYRFKVSVPAEDAVHVAAATDETDFRMISFVQKPDNPASTSVFAFAFDGSDSTGYNTRLFRIGTYSPESGIHGDYVECGPDMTVQPGRAFWFYSREDADIRISGTEVSTDHDIEVELIYHDAADPQWKGWNMIACPNNASYNWNELEVVVYDSECRPVFEGKIPEAGEYVDPVFWRYRKGYFYYSAGGPAGESSWEYDSDPILKPCEGCWARVFQENVFLRFSVSAQIGGVYRSGRKTVSGERNSNSTANIVEPPPLPFGRAGQNNNESAGENGGGCFVFSVLQ